MRVTQTCSSTSHSGLLDLAKPHGLSGGVGLNIASFPGHTLLMEAGPGSPPLMGVEPRYPPHGGGAWDPPWGWGLGTPLIEVGPGY